MSLIDLYIFQGRCAASKESYKLSIFLVSILQKQNGIHLFFSTTNLCNFGTDATIAQSPKKQGLLTLITTRGIRCLTNYRSSSSARFQENTLFQSLAAMANTHGPIFTIRLGAHRGVVVSSYETIKECFTSKDKVLASRPKSSQSEYLGYNYAVFFLSPYGEYWRNLRKLVTVHFLSSHRVKSLQHVQVFEVKTLIQDLYLFCNTNNNVVVNISEWLEGFAINTITSMMAGKRHEERKGKGKGDVIKEFMSYFADFVPSDLLPFLRWTKHFLGPVKAMKRVSKELDFIFQNWINEHKLEGSNSNHAQDLIHVLLSVLQDFTFGHSRESVIKATVLTFFMAGADKTSISLTWVLANLLNNRRILELAQHELDQEVGRDRWAEDSDIENLVYLKAIIKETLRLYPPAPVVVHEALEDCSVAGYCIPKGTRLFANVRKLHRDPNVWSNPDEFMPERFLTGKLADVEVLGRHFELIPFGSGRRSCPGANLALQMLHLTIARMLQGFTMATPANVGVDMSEGSSISLPKATPLHVQLIPRLSPKLYEN